MVCGHPFLDMCFLFPVFLTYFHPDFMLSSFCGLQIQNPRSSRPTILALHATVRALRAELNSLKASYSAQLSSMSFFIKQSWAQVHLRTTGQPLPVDPMRKRIFEDQTNPADVQKRQQRDYVAPAAVSVHTPGPISGSALSSPVVRKRGAGDMTDSSPRRIRLESAAVTAAAAAAASAAAHVPIPVAISPSLFGGVRVDPVLAASSPSTVASRAAAAAAADSSVARAMHLAFTGFGHTVPAELARAAERFGIPITDAGQMFPLHATHLIAPQGTLNAKVCFDSSCVVVLSLIGFCGCRCWLGRLPSAGSLYRSGCWTARQQASSCLKRPTVSARCTGPLSTACSA
jgi:hypothetical protein